MGEESFSIKGTLRGWAAEIGWRLFCWATDYPLTGHVCDYAPAGALPCDIHPGPGPADGDA